MTADWPQRILDAQAKGHYSSHGIPHPRIPFGSDDPRWGERPCRNCGVIKGELHVPDCEYEYCPVCRRGSLQSCDCRIDEFWEEPPPATAVDRAVSAMAPLAMWTLVAVIALCCGAIVWALIAGI